MEMSYNIGLATKERYENACLKTLIENEINRLKVIYLGINSKENNKQGFRRFGKYET